MASARGQLGNVRAQAGRRQPSTAPTTMQVDRWQDVEIDARQARGRARIDRYLPNSTTLAGTHWRYGFAKMRSSISAQFKVPRGRAAASPPVRIRSTEGCRF